MIVFCEECGAKNNLGPEDKTYEKDHFRCTFCGEALRIVPTQYLQARLMLNYQGKEIGIDRNRPVITIGRKPESDIVMGDRAVSRIHAYIIHRDDHFYLIDQSTNGTHIYINGGRKAYVKEDEFLLSGRGSISPARKVSPDSANVITFTILRKKESEFQPE
jgi:hypothetical protein